MAKFRNVSVKFWSDPFIESLTPERKLFYLYLITNEHTAQCGIYEITFKQMANESGYPMKKVEEFVDYFEKTGKIKFSRKTSEMAIKNFVKHNPQGSPTIKAFVEKELKNVKDRLLIAYIYATDTLSQEEETEEETEEQEKKEEPSGAVSVWPSFEDFWEAYDKKVDKPQCEKKWKKINQRAREKILEHVALYVGATPDPKYRKNPSTYLNNESWNDEIILHERTPKGNKQSSRELAAALQQRIMQDAIKQQSERSG